MTLTANGVSVPARVTLVPATGSTQTGYGRRLPTRYQVQLPGSARWRRVYCCIFANAGTCYVEDRTKPKRVREGGTIPRYEWIVIDN